MLLMGNYRFRLSDMIPNAWFYKLKDMGSSRSNSSRSRGRRRISTTTIKQKTQPSTTTEQLPPPPPRRQTYIPSRASYYIPSTEFCKPSDSPAKSNKIVTRTFSSSIDLTMEDMESNSSLPPILTRPTKKTADTKDQRCNPLTVRRSSPSSPYQGLKLRRPNSPRLARVHGSRRRCAPPTPPRSGLWRGFAVVKSSSDPHRDFRESMVEMIVENNILEAKDMEDLLECYLSLNSEEYHVVIAKVFQNIWFDLRNFTCKTQINIV